MYELERSKRNKRKFRQAFQIVTAFALLMVFAGSNVEVVLAAAAGSVDSMWNMIADFVGTWVFRMGGVTLFIGGVMFFSGWRSDDAEARSRGTNTMIAGGGVAMLSFLAGYFFGTS